MVEQACIPVGLTFDDVLLIPQRTRVESRKHVAVSTRLSRRVALKIPIVSSNVPWCTEAPMAIALARLGGIGILHRMTTVEAQVDQLTETKAALGDLERYPDATRDSWGRLAVGAAVGAKVDDRDRAARLVDAGADLLVVDIAHGHADYALDCVAALKSAHPEIDVIGGNVATADAVRDLVDAGADAVKVGIGPGGICSTRLVAGAGVPQLTAILDCVAEARHHDVPIIADGGIRTSGDIVKALAAGASSVMLGSLLAGTEESAAYLVEMDNRRYKISTGFVTLGVALTRKRVAGEDVSRAEILDYVPEGVEATFEYLGPLDNHVRQLIGGVQSGISYTGSASIPEMWRKRRFIRVTDAGRGENRPHAVDRAPQVHPDYKALFLDQAR